MASETAGFALGRVIADVESRSNIKAYKGAKVTSTGGYIGNYEVSIDTKDGEVTDRVGAMVVATGAVPLIPQGIFGYGAKGVITLMELEQHLKNNTLEGAGFAGKRMVFIQCAGARNQKKEFCARTCCMRAIAKFPSSPAE